MSKHPSTPKKKTLAKKPSTAKRDRRMAAAAEAIRQRLGLETLADRKRDALDFHDISVAAIREVIEIAFDAGWNAGFEAGSLLHE
ncbi:MAG: hypothetical protein KDA05_04430 [Phycisphaerales bacterium]|nr:hypothetical protein [Phycisphaerales bacterium]